MNLCHMSCTKMQMDLGSWIFLSTDQPFDPLINHSQQMCLVRVIRTPALLKYIVVVWYRYRKHSHSFVDREKGLPDKKTDIHPNKSHRERNQALHLIDILVTSHNSSCDHDFLYALTGHGCSSVCRDCDFEIDHCRISSPIVPVLCLVCLLATFYACHNPCHQPIPPRHHPRSLDLGR